jgi:hypothetical protein
LGHGGIDLFVGLRDGAERPIPMPPITPLMTATEMNAVVNFLPIFMMPPIS